MSKCRDLENLRGNTGKVLPVQLIRALHYIECDSEINIQMVSMVE